MGREPYLGTEGEMTHHQRARLAEQFENWRINRPGPMKPDRKPVDVIRWLDQRGYLGKWRVRQDGAE